MLKTQEIIEKYQISRQSLYNWFNDGKITRPQKNERSAYIWTEENEKEIIAMISEEQPANYLISKRQEKLKIGNRRYLGSKQKMLDFISRVVSETI